MTFTFRADLNHSGLAYIMAKDREWFKEYTLFESTMGHRYLVVDGARVAGIGTVELRTKVAPNRSGQRSHGTPILKDVLHVPAAIVNILGKPVVYFPEGNRFFKVRLSGSPVGPRLGPSALEDDGAYAFNAFWPNSERAKWEAYKAQAIRDSTAARYLPAEKKWLKENFESEFHFLIQHGLSIYKDEDREESRAIVRAMMQKFDRDEGISPDREDSEDLDDDDDDEEGEEDEEDLDGHLADYNFTERELNWIEKHYRNSMAFMFSYGLKFYDQEDCNEAKTIIKGLM
ncbi:hypothetical protein AJ80_07515 [Polytolypa hystricis UAMH7299]|uniref:Retrovirus-related Pol polyprotein from transposon TNT 1-94-like beta-barrel domain-containing protein n=1 Tax=Polytolypa hystricis (strain UAMH7299) TaxID=1447883 RepID=A0A2B7XPA6_POLH7|nr:hypothetical protein AJ80_07515 [Polytolypa hystricis UAMH7299]